MTLRRDKDVERLLRANRPEPRDELVRDLAAHARRAPAPRSWGRFALAGALSAAMLAALAAVGGLSYAATAVTQVAKAVEKVVAPSSSHTVVKLTGITAGGDQYRPGYGFGDPNHNHTGPPGLKKEAPTKVKVEPNGEVKVSTAILVDEQAHLTINVIGPDGKEVVIDQGASKIGRGVKGPKTKAVQYLLLIPRTIPLDVTIPKAAVRPGVYKIRVIARAPNGEKTVLEIPFRP